MKRLCIVKMLKRLLEIRFRRTTLIIFLSISFLIGVVTAPYSSISVSWLLLALLFVLVLFRRQILALLLVIVIGLIVGQLRGLSDLRYEAPLSNLAGQKVEISGVVSEDSYYDSRKRLVTVIQTEYILSPYQAEVTAPLRVTTFSVSDLKRGDIVRVKGTLYQTLGNYIGVINFAEVEITARQVSWFTVFRRNFEAGLRNALPEPQASFAAGLLIGQRSGLPDIWQDILRDVGLTHIIAVSGFNLTIIVAFSRRLLRKGSRYQILVVSSLLVFCFVAVTGLSPSILRATVVVALLQLAWFFGKQFRPLVLISLAAAITIWIDPSQMWRSIGWYLSFAAFFGIIVIAPLLNNRMRPTLSTSLEIEKNPLKSLVIESVSALAMTAPIVIIVFGRVSTVALLTNVIVAPLIPISMLFSLIAGLGGMWFPVVSGIIGLPARLVLTIILDIANIASQVPGAAIEVTTSWWSVGVMYGILASLCGAIYFIRRRRLSRVMVE